MTHIVKFCGNVFISTRFGVGVTDEEWLNHRLRLFEAITAPSIRSQTFQDFVWNIFVGESVIPWVVIKLEELTKGIGAKVLIHKKSQSATVLNEVFSSYGKHEKNVLFLIDDDDDAWRRDYIAEALANSDKAFEYSDKSCFTFPVGYEWLVADSIDIDALQQKNLRLLRPASIRRYVRPFLTMSCIFFFKGSIHKDFGSVHSSKGDALKDVGYQIYECSSEEPMWLYVRHKQADSALVKAGPEPSLALDLTTLENNFGINAHLVTRYREDEQNYRYSLKRSHAKNDKSSMLIDVQIAGGFKVANVYTNNLKVNSVKIFADFAKVQLEYDGTDKLRVAVFSHLENKFSEILELIQSRNFKVRCPIGSNSFENFSFRVQELVEEGGQKKWRNRTKLIPFVTCDNIF